MIEQFDCSISYWTVPRILVNSTMIDYFARCLVLAMTVIVT